MVTRLYPADVTLADGTRHEKVLAITDAGMTEVWGSGQTGQPTLIARETGVYVTASRHGWACCGDPLIIWKL